MTVQDQINAMFENLKHILEEIIAVRERAVQIEAGLFTVSREYATRLQTLNSIAVELNQRLEDLRIQLKPIVTPPKAHNQTSTTASTVVNIPIASTQVPAQNLTADLRDKRKRDLADYLEEIVSLEDHEMIMQQINACVVDDQQDIGNILELLTWGAIWLQRTPYETLDDQLSRLNTWQQALNDRLGFWKIKVRRLEKDSTYALWQDRQLLTTDQWEQFLDNLAVEQLTANQSLQKKIDVLQEQLKAKIGGEVTHG
ncbi:hypothetical protein [Herpetosiphon giganteus]|uniref:hypothetical protein n=1 Tax=Herpetosiphon giganteus TaxID=2029754 RepID=UPI00195BDE2F|nr:hypothetical protein [Herpetosiphon giganteus]MBM7845943.1 enamine deaminase RidA (YjgF/YER057c/UK114 family) [Herpetosiphon giganteus]